MLGAGLTLVVTVGLFAYGGHLLDGLAGTSPLFLLLGMLLGAAGGFIHLFSVVAPGMLPWGRSRRGAGTRDPERSDSPPDASSEGVDQDPDPEPRDPKA